MPEDEDGINRRRIIALLGGMGAGGAGLTWGAVQIAEEALEYSESERKSKRRDHDNRQDPTETVTAEEYLGTDTPESSPETTSLDERVTETPYSTETEVNYPHVEKVELRDLPDRWETGEEVEISGSAHGYDLDSIRILERRQGSIEVDVIAEEEIDTEGWTEYNIDTDSYEVENQGQVDYWIEAIAGSDKQHSIHKTIEFYN